MDNKERLEKVMKIPILQVAGELGINVINEHCTRCIHPKKGNQGLGNIEFNIKENSYKCACLQEKGNVIDMVKNVLKCDDDQAINWLFEKFHLKIIK